MAPRANAVAKGKAKPKARAVLKRPSSGISGTKPGKQGYPVLKARYEAQVAVNADLRRQLEEQRDLGWQLEEQLEQRKQQLEQQQHNFQTQVHAEVQRRLGVLLGL